MSVQFFVAGVPVPQGSKTAFVVGRRAVITDQNAKVLKPWRTAVAEAAQSAIPFDGPLGGAVWVEVEFRFLRPKSVSEKARPWPSVKPDNDKLQRALLDGLTASGLIGDDAAVVDIVSRKRYSERPGAVVRVGLMVEREEAGL